LDLVVEELELMVVAEYQDHQCQEHICFSEEVVKVVETTLAVAAVEVVECTKMLVQNYTLTPIQSLQEQEE
jgi:hypothetical protein